MKKTTVALILIACLLAAGVAWAVNEYVISDHVIVEIEEAILTLEVSVGPYVRGDILRFNGTLTSESVIFVGANVTLWCNSTYTGYSNLTDADGAYEIFYPTAQIGTFDFYANATVT